MLQQVVREISGYAAGQDTSKINRDVDGRTEMQIRVGHRAVLNLKTIEVPQSSLRGEHRNNRRPRRRMDEPLGQQQQVGISGRRVITRSAQLSRTAEYRTFFRRVVLRPGRGARQRDPSINDMKAGISELPHDRPGPVLLARNHPRFQRTAVG
ncbi:hypothetical protein GCM10009827_019290 [Dactylosporangium maewongense]|uniref:Uncharacterized protein n=1 Tax=Dactylosporangium maewongense TaxID=634393 RepID=A0ABN1ZX23_9ACTN